MKKSLLKRNTVITSAKNGQEYIVDAVISSGTGQGDIYKVHNDKGTFALKLFHSGNDKKLLKQFDLLIKRGKICTTYVYPLDIIQHGEHVGYVMEYIGKEYKDASVLFNGIEKDGQKIELAFDKKLTLLYNITDAFRILNEADLGLMDIKFDNIKVNLEDGTIKVLDTDTIVYTKDKSIVMGTIGFMPPLTMRGEEKPNKYNDSYALAVLIFMTLIGSHPLIGRLSEKPCHSNIEQYMFAAHPVYVFHKQDVSNRPIAADERSQNQQRTIDRIKKYPEYFREAMHQTFVQGLYDGEKRTTPREWLEIFDKLYEESYTCQNCGEELFFGGVLKKCDVCGKELVQPVRICCGKKSIPLFNGNKIFTSDLWNDGADYELFKIVVSEYDKKFGLYCVARDAVGLELKNGLCKSFGQGDIIPIFLDGIITVNNNKIKFLGGSI